MARLHSRGRRSRNRYAGGAIDLAARPGAYQVIGGIGGGCRRNRREGILYPLGGIRDSLGLIRLFLFLMILRQNAR